MNRNTAEPGQLPKSKVCNKCYLRCTYMLHILLVSINKCDLHSLYTARLIQRQGVQERGRDFENLLY